MGFPTPLDQLQTEISCALEVTHVTGPFSVSPVISGGVVHRCRIYPVGPIESLFTESLRQSDNVYCRINKLSTDNSSETLTQGL